MTDEPNNTTDHPNSLPADGPGQREVEEVLGPRDTGDEAAAPPEPPQGVAADVPAQPQAVETPTEAAPTEAEADREQSGQPGSDAATEAPGDLPSPETPVEATTRDEAAESEVIVSEAAEPPEGDVAPSLPQETASGEAIEEPAGTVVTDANAEQPAAEEVLQPASAQSEGDAAEPVGPAEETPAEAPLATSAQEAADVAGQEAADEEGEGEGEAAKEDGEPKSENMDWYILKVQSNREDSIREGLMRRVAIAGLDRYFGQVIVPTEKVTEFKGGKKRVTKRKLYPGYLVVQMEINDDTWFLVRETPGIGDFTGAAGHPTPMLPHEVSGILAKQEEKTEKAPKLKIGFNPGDQVKINEGTFENFEGEVDSIDQTNGQVTVMINIFGRSTPVTLEYWQIEAV